MYFLSFCRCERGVSPVSSAHSTATRKINADKDLVAGISEFRLSALRIITQVNASKMVSANIKRLNDHYHSHHQRRHCAGSLFCHNIIISRKL